MGGMQAYHWAACHPDMVERAAIVCGSARCSPYNHVFLEGVKAALTADPAFGDGRFVAKPAAGLRAMGRVYAGWAMSHAFYRDEVWREFGFNSLEDYLVTRLGWTSSPGATPTICWRRSASGSAATSASVAEFGGNIDRALAAIKARVLLMPGQTDRYFDVRDNEDELGRLVNAQVGRTASDSRRSTAIAPAIPSTIRADRAFIKAEISALLQT